MLQQQTSIVGTQIKAMIERCIDFSMICMSSVGGDNYVMMGAFCEKVDGSLF